MTKRMKSELVQARFFRWRMMRKQFDVWYADGRSNKPSAGRHSLGTKDESEALKLVHQLDAEMAVKHGLADRGILDSHGKNLLTIAEGARAYMTHVGRPAVAGGASKKTIKRYEPVFRKFAEYAASQGILAWQGVSKGLVEGYASWMVENGYAYRTQYLELTTIKQAMLWFVEEGLLPQTCLFKLRLQKADGSPTYAYTDTEVLAILDHCDADPELDWLGRVIRMLVYTGMRIGELSQLIWSDIDIDARVIHIRDETRGAASQGSGTARSTKSRRSRTVPINSILMDVLGRTESDRSALVFHGPRGGQIKPDTVRNFLKRDLLPVVAKKISSPKMLQGRVHSFRHTFCTFAYRAGWPERTILDVMGHTDSSITRLYRHLAEDEHRQAMENLGEVLKGESAGEIAQ